MKENLQFVWGGLFLKIAFFNLQNNDLLVSLRSLHHPHLFTEWEDGQPLYPSSLGSG